MRGIADNAKRRAIFENSRFNADLLILQETHSTIESEKVWRNEWGGDVIFSHGTSNARGIAIFIKKEISQQVQNIYRDTDGRLIIVDVVENDQKISVVAIYVPNEDSPGYFSKIEQELMKRSEHKIIVGDFNLTLDVELDRENTYCNNNKAKEQVENIMDQFSLVDIWRIRNEDKKEFSWIKRGS